ARRVVRGVEEAEWHRRDLYELWHAAGLHGAVRREEVLHCLGADAPFECAIDVRVEARCGKVWAFMQREMEPVERPGGILKAVELAAERLRQLLAANKLFELLLPSDPAGSDLG